MTRGGVTAAFRSFVMSRCAARAVSSTLDQDVENEAILIDGAPKPVGLASNRDDEASGAGESHPRALSEPDVTLSRHPAPIVRPRPWIKLQ